MISTARTHPYVFYDFSARCMLSIYAFLDYRRIGH